MEIRTLPPPPGGSFSVETLRDTEEGRAWLLVNGIRSDEYVKGRKKHDGQKSGKTSAGPFVAWDGEGITVRNHHRYILLCNSYGHHIYNGKGMRTLDALHFLCDEAGQEARANHVMYGASYDVNMMLGDLGSHHVAELAWTGKLHWADFRIEYRPRKELMVTRYSGRHITANKDITIQLWDVIGFFQCRFVTALEAWLRDLDAETLAYIERMKGKRSGFAKESLEEVMHYCFKECDLLEMLMTRMRNKMRPVKLIPNRWDGAGAIAQKLLQNHSIPNHRGEVSAHVSRASQHAYFGGRIECVRYGNHEGPVWSHDINSAYPSATRNLPCLAHGRWSHRNDSTIKDDGAYRLGHVRWSFDTIGTVHPLPWRERNGSVFFPASGEGWYWQPELELLREFRPRQYQLLETWTFHPTCDEEPFAFVTDVYEQRRRMKQAGHDANIILKLALNSIYGKLAQKVGWNRDKGLPPRYHQLEWAGYITSETRAKLFRLAVQHPEEVIAFETDGLYSTVQHSCAQGTALGEWEVDTHEGITYLQSGLYWLKDDGVWWSKSRGLARDADGGRSSALTRDRVLASWSAGTWEVEVTETRFRTMASAITSAERFTEWRQWCEDTKTLTTIPRGKRMALPADLTSGEWAAAGLHRTLAAGGGGMSHPHLLPWVDGYEEMPAEVEFSTQRMADEERLEGI